MIYNCDLKIDNDIATHSTDNLTDNAQCKVGGNEKSEQITQENDQKSNKVEIPQREFDTDIIQKKRTSHKPPKSAWWGEQGFEFWDVVKL